MLVPKNMTLALQLQLEQYLEQNKFIIIISYLHSRPIMCFYGSGLFCEEIDLQVGAHFRISLPNGIYILIKIYYIIVILNF